jgi:hypothetical protein
LQYNFTLSVPSGADYDLYLYNMTGDAYGQPVIVAKSTTAVVGGFENITYTPALSGKYYVVVKRARTNTGGGQFTLTSTGAPNAVPVVNYVHVWGYPGGLLDPAGSINRTGTVRIYAGVSDLETASNLLNVTIKFKAQAGLGWTNITATLWESLYGGYWYYDWIVPGTASLGLYDVTVEVSDAAGGFATVTETGEFNVTNTVPIINYIHAWGYPGELLDPEGAINRGATVRIFTGVWDSETAADQLTVTIGYKAQGDSEWTNITSTQWEPLYGGYWYHDWTIPAGASLGLYDVRVEASDESGGSVSATEYGEFTVANANPVINYVHAWGYPGELLDPEGVIGRGGTVRIFAGVSDSETAPNSLSVTIKYKAQADPLWTNITSTSWEPLYGGYWYYDWVVSGTASTGFYDVIVEVSDGVGEATSVTETGEFNVTNAVPVINYVHAWGYPGELLDPAGTISRGATVRMFTGVRDSETASSLLSVTIKYKAQAGGEWTNITSTLWEPLYGGYWYYDWVVPGTASTGLYDVTITVSDGNGGSASATETGEFTVVDQFTITPTAGIGGSISPDTAQTVNYGDTPSFTIMADTGYHILDVTVDSTSVLAYMTGDAHSGTYTFSAVDADHAIDAAFEIDQFTITPGAGEHGSIYPDNAQTVNYGDTPSFDITADTGYHILDVTVDGNSVLGDLAPDSVSAFSTPAPLESGTYTFSPVDANHDIYATFTINTYTITVTQSSNGDIYPPGTSEVEYGSTPSFTIMPDTGYHIESITANGSPVTVTDPTGQTYQFDPVTADGDLTATFAPDEP